MKKCTVCLETKGLDDFYPKGGRVNQTASECKLCSNERNRQYCIKNADKIRQRQLAYYKENVEERRRAAREYGKRNREKIGQRYREKRYDLSYSYNISPDEYDAMLAAQGGGCAICGRQTPGGNRTRFSVDHNHSCCPPKRSGVKSCGKCVRGLICQDCNIGLGRFKDNVKLLTAAIEYLNN